MMKRKGQEDKRATLLQPKRVKKQVGYIGDPRLIPRVKEYIEGHGQTKSINIAVMADYLQREYGEYCRKKRSAFLKSVERAYTVVRDEGLSSSEAEDSTSQLEKKHLSAKKWKNTGSGMEVEDDDVDDDDVDDKSFSSDNEEYVDYEDKNSMNSMMANMYRNTPEGDVKKPLQTSEVPTVKGGNSSSTQEHGSYQDQAIDKGNTVQLPFVIDRSGSSTKFVDVIARQNAVTKKTVNDQALVEKNTSTETPEKKTKLKKQPQKTPKKSPEDKGKEAKRKGPVPQQSTVTFSDVGGNDRCLQEVCKLLVHMRHPEVYQRLGVTPPRGFLLHGPPGCGKTLMAHAIAGELDLPFMKLAATEIVSGVSGESEEKIRELFDSAVATAPCILFIDEIDAITPKRETASKDMERRIVSQLLSCMDDLNSRSSAHVLVIGATNRPDSLDPALRRAGRFDKEISMGIPDENARKRILEVLCRNLKLSVDFDFLHLAHYSPGYVGADLMALTQEAAMIAVSRVFNELQSDTADSVEQESSNAEISPRLPRCEDGTMQSCNSADKDKTDHLTTTDNPSKETEDNLKSVLLWLKKHPPLTDQQLQDLYITMDDFKEALKHVQPSAKREGFATVPDVTWDDIGALHSVREELQIAILAPVKHAEAFRNLGLTRAQGILLAGPPGCGKTLLAKAVANESGINFISVKGPELLNMYVGESERAVRQVFQRARNSAPCVIFFDELDALCPRRSDFGEGGSSVRVVNQLLTEMDGLEERKQVFIMGATNRPDIIDPAILRPGRLDKVLYVGLPSVEDRIDILKTITKNGTKPSLSSDVKLEEVAQDSRCLGFTGADLAALVREASISSLKEVLMDNVLMGPTMLVNRQHFEKAFGHVRPSVSEKEMQRYNRMRENMQTS